MHKIPLSLLALIHVVLFSMDKKDEICHLDNDQKLAYYLNTYKKIPDLTDKVLQLLEEGVDVNRRISCEDEAIKIVLKEQGYTAQAIADAVSEYRRESWTPLISIAQRNYKPISGPEQRLITNSLLHKGARADAGYHSSDPEMNGMTARNFAYQSEVFRDFTETLADFEYQQWLKEVAKRNNKNK